MSNAEPYRHLCRVLAGQPERVPWHAFSPVDWHELIETARTERVAPLLHHALNEAGWPGDVPAQLRDELAAIYYDNLAYNLVLYAELTRIVKALDGQTNQRSVAGSRPAVIVLKGAVLAKTVYPDVGLRPMNDLDFLVSPEALDRSIHRLQSIGYRDAYPDSLPALYRITGRHARLRGGPRDEISVELHWNLIAGNADWRTPALDWFWTQTTEWSVENGEGEAADLSISQLTPTAHLLYLAAHLALQHGTRQALLLWFYDIHRLITCHGDAVDWTELEGQARELRWTAAVLSTLHGVADRFGTPLPAGFLAKLRASEDRQATRAVQRKARLPETRSAIGWEALMPLSWPARLRFTWEVLCPSPDYVRWLYKPQPAWSWPLYYPYRWLEIAYDGFKTLAAFLNPEKGDGRE